ncbi:hypothetical protein TVAG_207550 [Trichomonas vaginalis G3]|uniref:Uncharacterized protein n=1 Tax=Trichomonas vaginalis (strain ATCC PRA-98 / G3) TaxID=412133 RepID=A2F2L8_TRIV3|nr:hypothetical protein TVAGG3_0105300 [Trichomonas vaginalis G3]EAY00852.1 hypothetical protein TVAG_207550 [Trichomonas vaginalis G3]KAI5544610.1 hypothetical protein TVAGG3_0105300 [Trichomonas vaginalis G3]|eukprot:XP_001313781.1 hypothetical protein [Trichomonas vaginalis G3]
MTEIPDSEVPKQIEIVKADIKRLQQLITNYSDQLRASDERVKEQQDKIREINNNNKEKQREIDYLKTQQNSHNEYLDKQSKIILAKIDLEHQKVLEQRANLFSQEKNGSREIQDLENRYKHNIKLKYEKLEKKKLELEEAERNLSHLQQEQEEQIKYILKLNPDEPQAIQEEEDVEEEISPEKITNDSYDKVNSQILEIFKQQFDLNHKHEALNKQLKILTDLKDEFQKSISQEREKSKH